MGNVFSEQTQTPPPQEEQKEDPTFLLLRNLDVPIFDVREHLRKKRLALNSEHPDTEEGLRKLAEGVTRIDISVNKIEHLCEEIDWFTNLDALIINTNKLWQIPPQIKNNNNLTFLSLAGNDFSQDPRLQADPSYEKLRDESETSFLANLKNLRTLSLANSKISLLTPDIYHLDSLKVLLLPLNRLDSFPPQPDHLTTVFPFLERFVLASNLYQIVPSVVYNISNLTELYLNDNQLIEISEQISNLSNLQTLNLSHNKLTTLPDSIGSLVQLKQLDISRNELIHLPESLSLLTALEGLSLRNNKLTRLPEQLGNLNKLTLLLISLNRIESLPPSIGQIAVLEQLDARGNQIKQVPESFGNLKGLGLLALSGNPDLSEIPQSVLDLKQNGKLSCLDFEQPNQAPIPSTESS